MSAQPPPWHVEFSFTRREPSISSLRRGKDTVPQSRSPHSLSVVALAALAAAALLCAAKAGFLESYKGTLFHDSRYPGGPQKIPGKVMCAYYDFGGEGVAYHDSDMQNSGSGMLNPADGSYLNEFRKSEGVDISYTKFRETGEPIDNNPYNKVVPPKELLYVGWTVPGEWFNMTVETDHASLYAADLLYTSNRGGMISVDVNGEPATGPLPIVSTADPADPVAWRQWHHWNIAPGLVRLKLPAGKSVLTVHILTEGNMNLATLDFKELR